MGYFRAFMLSAAVAFAGVVGLALAKHDPGPPTPPAVKPLTQTVHVREQIQVGELGRLKDAGYRTIINLRPDGEARNQPASAEVRRAAEAVGLRYAFVPTPTGTIPDAVVDEVMRALAGAEGNVLLYCRSGNRAARVWALAEASRGGGFDRSRILQAVSEAGQRADDLVPRIDARIAARN